MNSFPRPVYFSRNNICVGVGTGVHGEFSYSVIMDLPSDHYDYLGPFGGVIKGLHKNQIISLLYDFSGVDNNVLKEMKPKDFYTEAEIPKDKIGDYAMTVGGLYYLPGE